MTTMTNMTILIYVLGLHGLFPVTLVDTLQVVT